MADSGDGEPRLPVRRRQVLVSGSVAGVAGCMGPLQSDPVRYEPEVLLLTWQEDPTSTITIDWHDEPDADAPSTVSYRPESNEDWSEATADAHSFELYDREIYRVEVGDLRADTTYEFRFEDEPTYRFRTLPETLDRDVRFAVGGDSDPDPPEDSTWGRVVDQTMGYDLDFFMIAGDLAYADGGDRGSHLERWHNWLEVATNRLQDDENRMVPIVAGIGNHECVDGYWYSDAAYEDSDRWREGFAPYFYNFFAFPGHPGYGVLDLGEYASIPMLDSDHTNPIMGDQTDWLESVLAERTDVDHVLPTYHVPGWPSVRYFNGRTETDVREHWVPLFEEYNVRLVFEHHDHAFNVTYPLRDGEIDPSGVVYVGDGPLGHSERDPGFDRWFMNRTKARYNADVVTISDEGIRVQTVDDQGTELHELSRDGPEYAIRHYPHISVELIATVVETGDEFGLRTEVINSTPVSMTDLTVSVEGRGATFDFETDDPSVFDELPSRTQERVSWTGTAPDEEDDFEILTTVAFTVDGEEREETRTDWIPVGW